MNIHEVVGKLTGPIYPVGETRADDDRHRNLLTTISLAEYLLEEITWVMRHNKDRVEYSMKRSGETAQKALKSIRDEINENL